jgi:glucokinase
MAPNVFPSIEIGGSHVSTARVDLASRRLERGTRRHMSLDSTTGSDDIIGQIVSCAEHSAAEAPEAWGIAIPGAFDYGRGVGLFAGAGKFESLDGIPLRPLLRRAIKPTPLAIAFLNDADAFLLGEWLGGAAAGRRMAVGITLGTGIGSAFIEDGVIVNDDPRIPPEGRVDLLTIGDRPLEETVSHRAIVSRYAALRAHDRSDRDEPVDGVRGITARARAGDAAAVMALDVGFRALGAALAPWLASFPAPILVAGGGMIGAWDMIEPSLRRGLEDADRDVASHLVLVASGGTEDAALLGAAYQAAREA